MISYFNETELTNLKKQIQQKLNDVFSNFDYKMAMGVQIKADKSAVTDIDLFISHSVKRLYESNEKLKNFHFFSEEDQESFQYPGLILDPIDGTRELVRGIPECAVSIACAQNNQLQGWGMIFNPFTSFEINSSNPWVIGPTINQAQLLGLVSRSEWEKGIYSGHTSGELILAPRGSIAFKLGLLASGACDFVATLQPKNIWDIAAGTILCQQRGIYMYHGDEKIERFDERRLSPPLYWCREEYFKTIRKFIF